MENLKVSPLALLMGGLTISSPSVAPIASLRAMLVFAAKHGVKPQIERFPMTQAGVAEAMQKLREGKMRYRGVLVAA